MISQRQKEVAEAGAQSFIHGIITGYSANLYSVNALGQTFFAESLTPDRFLTGDRVFMVLGAGTPRILGLQGKDQDSL